MNKQTKHTAGPWTHYKDLQYGWLIKDSNEKDLEYNEANARLIASAPELLEGLKEAVEAFSSYGISEVEHLKAVIAKAEGK
jgi:hypothetical protein